MLVAPDDTLADNDSPARHTVQLYEQDTFLVDAVSRFVGAGLGAGDAVVVIATEAHHRELESQLRSRGLALTISREQGRFVMLDAGETLAQFMGEGGPDVARFEEVVGGVIAAAAKRAPKVRAFGEMVAILWAAGARDSAIRLEALWNDLGNKLGFSLLCAYPLAAFADGKDTEDLRRVCAQHTRVLPAESYTVLTDPEERLRTVAELQQRARALETEAGERGRAQKALERAQRELNDFFENATIPFHWVGPDGRILQANRAELELLGYTAAEYVGRHIAEFHVEAPVIDDLLRRLTRGEAVTNYASQLRCKDGSTKHVLIDSSVLFEDGKFLHTRCFTRDVTDRNRAHDAFARLAAIIEGSDDAIIGKTLEGIVTSWNKGAENTFGYTAEEMVGQPISRLVPPEHIDGLPTILAAIRRGKRVEHFETERVRKDGRRVQVSLTVSPIRDAAGRIVGASKIARDVTERKLADAERDKLMQMADCARAEAEAANRAKDEFLAMLGHELRNPLSSVRNAIVTAMVDSTRRSRALEIARRGADQLTRLVGDLLDVARITRGQIALRHEAVALSDVIDRAMESARPLFEERGLAFTVSLPARDIEVNGDAARLEQVIGNLLGNAAKYTEPGGKVTLTLDSDEAQAVLRVRDTGIGITPVMLPRVFDLFAQADQALDRSQGGLGIGLTLVKRLVELHQGSVEAHSDGLGKGAEIIVRLPMHVRVRTDMEPIAMPAIREERCARVLIVEDNADAAEAMMMLLELLGHQVQAAADGLSAIELARANRPDVMLVDIGLPGISGYEVAERIRQDEHLRGITLVALTGYGRPEDRGRALEAGFDHHLVKPVDVEKFQRLVAQLSSGDATVH